MEGRAGVGAVDGSVQGAVEYLHAPGTLLVSGSNVHMLVHVHARSHTHGALREGHPEPILQT